MCVYLLTCFHSLELKSNINLLQENKMESLKTKINLGSEFYMQAKVYASNNIMKMKYLLIPSIVGQIRHVYLLMLDLGFMLSLPSQRHWNS